jgi:polyhydroxyalkanoate synthesis regulator phasin
MSNGQDAGIREKLKELAEVSRDLDRHSQMSKTASHPIQAQQVRKRIDELTEQQSSMMNALVDKHPNEERRSNFQKLGAQVETLKEEIRGCEDKEKLIELEGQIEAIVDSWILAFQVIVSELAGVQPPSQAVYDN